MVGAASAAKVGQARARAADVLLVVRQAQAADATPLHQFTNVLTAQGIPTPSGTSTGTSIGTGCGTWQPASALRVLAYAEAA